MTTIQTTNHENEGAIIRLVDAKTPYKTRDEMKQALMGVELFFIEQSNPQVKEFAEVASEVGILAVGVVSSRLNEEEKQTIRIL